MPPTGKNALAQIDRVQGKWPGRPITGLIMTKLDGTARGGVLGPRQPNNMGLPIHAIGVGEKMEDLRPSTPIWSPA